MEAGQGEIWIKHYSNKQKILLVGEGDFSFAVCLAKAFGYASNIIATSLDSEGTLRAKYPASEVNLKCLKDRGTTTVHEVDVRNMSEHPGLKHMLFDRILFNFPHAGFAYKEHQDIQILLHQDVVRSFLKSARHMLKHYGEVHVTHKTGGPFHRWIIQQLGEEVGLRLIEQAPFNMWNYPGYLNRRGADKFSQPIFRSSNDTFPVGECSTYKFVKY